MANDNTVGYSPNKGFNTKKIIGGTILGGMVGTGAYYIPIRKNDFIDEAFKITKKNIDSDIVSLKIAATEVANSNLSNDSKILLKKFEIGENENAILNKCKSLLESVTDSASVKNLKNSFDTGFKGFKKQASLMDNNMAEAMKNLKINNLQIGAIIGAGVGLALSMLNSRD